GHRRPHAGPAGRQPRRRPARPADRAGCDRSRAPRPGSRVMRDLTDQAIEPSSRLPLYAQLEQILEQQLMSGELKAGDMLPTDAPLCAQFGISRPVVRQAISGFVARGQLYRLRGKGTFVSGAPLAERLLRPTL